MKNIWNKIYQNKRDDEVSWYQEKPERSIALIVENGLKPSDSLIDIGGGNSHLAESLLNLGHTKLSVLDISETALMKTKKRMGERHAQIEWIVSDILQFTPKAKYHFWHDRAAFHFLTKADDVDRYVWLASEFIEENGILIIGCFSTSGPEKCSGMPITQYDSASLAGKFSDSFNLLSSFEEIHITPFDTEQVFLYSVFRRKSLMITNKQKMI